MPEQPQADFSEEEEGVSCEIMVCRTFNSKLSFVLFFNFYWSIVDLQCCIRFRCVLFFQFFLCIKLSFFIAVHQLSLIAASRDYSSYLSTGSRAHTHTHTHTHTQTLEHTGFSSCGTQAQLVWGMWDLPRPGINPVFPALAGRFLTNGPPGKSLF